MNTYIVFRLDGVKKFAYCIAPVSEDRSSYNGGRAELATDTAVEPWPLYWDLDCGDDISITCVQPIRDGDMPDRDAAIHRARTAIAAWRAYEDDLFAPEAPTT